MRRAHVVFAHPCEESFSAALHRKVVDSLGRSGWDVDDCDLNAEGFDPVLTAAERRGYHDTATNRAPVAPYVDRLLAAEALVLVFPVWNYGFPAIMKGWVDRVWLPGVTFTMGDGKEGGGIAPALRNVKAMAAVSTYGGDRLRTFLAGDPPRKVVTRAMRAMSLCRRCRYLALHDMNNTRPEARAAFLDRVGREMARL